MNQGKITNQHLLLIILGISLLVTFRLSQVALETNNWAGFFWSELHLVIVAVGSYLILTKNTKV